MITNSKVAYHRNGISGWPFYVVTFNWKDGAKDRRMVATVPVAEGSLRRSDCVISVLDVDMLANGDTAFASNSWRGDHFADDVWKAINAFDKAL